MSHPRSLEWFFLTQGLNLCFCHWQVVSLPLSHWSILWRLFWSFYVLEDKAWVSISGSESSWIMLSLSECLKHTRENALGLVAFGVFTPSHDAQTKDGFTRRGSWLDFDITTVPALTAEDEWVVACSPKFFKNHMGPVLPCTEAKMGLTWRKEGGLHSRLRYLPVQLFHFCTGLFT